MQNKGFVRVFAILLTLVCVFYLSFSFVTRHYTSKAKEFAKGDVKVEQDYLDSLANEKVYFGNWTLKQCREMEISLGLDLKGGMNVILEVSVPDVIKVLADNKTDEAFNQALATAAKQATTSQDDVITLFVREYHKLAPGAPLSQLFATQQLKDKVTQKSTDAEVEKVLREEVKAAVENSYNALRTRIDRFGVVQPNIQSLEDKMGRIMVELPGIKEPERVKKIVTRFRQSGILGNIHSKRCYSLSASCRHQVACHRCKRNSDRRGRQRSYRNSCRSTSYQHSRQSCRCFKRRKQNTSC